MPPSSPFLSSLAAYSPSSLPICKLYDPNPLCLFLECSLSKHDPKAFTDFETGQLIYSTFKITADGDYSHEIKRCLLLGRKVMTSLHIKNQRHYFANKGPTSQSYDFSSSNVCMWELDSKEIWVPKNWCFWAVVLEKTLESPFDCKEIQPLHPKRNQSWVFIGTTDIEAETPILLPPDAKSSLIWKDPDAQKDWRQEKKGMTEDEMIG